MKSTLTLIAWCALVPVIACSGASDGDSPAPSAGAPGSAGALTNTAGASVGGASAGSSSSGAATAGTLQAGGSAGTTSAAAGSAGSASSAGSGVAGSASGSGGNGAAAGAGSSDGAALYAANCGACHGTQGVGGTLAPELQHPVRGYSAYIVRYGLPGTGFPGPMTIIAPAKVSDADLTLIWDYLDEPAQPTTGQALYHDYCANCHGADGKGGPTGRGILNELGKLKSQVRKGASLGQFGMRKDYMPAFTAVQISDAELNLIYTYVDAL